MPLPAVKRLLLPALLAGTILLFRCSDWHSWTEEDRKSFESDCAKTDSVEYLTIGIVGYENNAFDSITVYEYEFNTLLDTFRIFAEPAQSPMDRQMKRRWARIGHRLRLIHRFDFHLPGQVFALDSMRMGMVPHYTNDSESYGCEMCDYYLDGVHFHDFNPMLVRKEQAEVSGNVSK